MFRSDAECFMEAIRLALFGVIAQNRNGLGEETEEINSIWIFLMPATGMMAYLSMMYPEWNLPQNTQEMLSYFLMPANIIYENLPEIIREELPEGDKALFEGGSILENYGDSYFLTDDGWDFVSQRMVNKTFRSEKKNDQEYRSQKLYELMCSKTQKYYNLCRSFVENPDNLFFSTDVVNMSKEQDDFVREEQEIFSSAYEKRIFTDNKIAICPTCGAPLIKRRNDLYYCVSSQECNRRMNTKALKWVKTETSCMYVLRPEPIHDIYYPAILERKIESFLKRKNLSYERWPEMDSADFRVVRKDGTIVYLDAKRIHNLEYLVWDRGITDRENNGEPMLLYVLEKKSERDLERINRKLKKNGKKAKCVRLNDLENSLMEDDLNEV